MPFSKVSGRILEVLADNARRKGWPIPRKGFFSPYVDMSLSALCLDEGEVTAYAIVERLSGYLSVSAVWSAGDDLALILLLSAVLSRARKKEREDSGVVIHTINMASYKLVEYMLPMAKKVAHTMERELY